MNAYSIFSMELSILVLPISYHEEGLKKMKNDMTFSRLFQIGLRFWEAKALLSAIELGVFTELAEGPLDLQTLTTRVGIHPRSARDFFDALVSLQLLERQDGNYSNVPDTDFFLDKQKPTYAAGFLEMANARLYPLWGSLTEGLRTGLQQNEGENGDTDMFEALVKDPAALRIFLEGMTGQGMGGTVQALSQKFPWHQYKTFMDVGAAQGAYLVHIAQDHRGLTGYGFDLPPVQPFFEEYIGQFGLQNRLHFVGGNFFTDDLPHADVIIMAHVLHDWNLEEKQLLTGKAYEALPVGGALIVCDPLIDDDRRENTWGLLANLNMLLDTPGGFEYTGADGISWMKTAGFRHIYVEHLAGVDSMLVGIK
jgi:hypothetical protein